MVNGVLFERRESTTKMAAAAKVARPAADRRLDA